MPVRLIVSDLDGTLFRRDRSTTISGENLKAIADAQARGIPFFVCTGRPITDIYKNIYCYEELKDAGIAGMNGATVIRSSAGEPIFNRRLPEEIWRGCVEIIRKYPVESVMTGSLFRNRRLWLEYPTERMLLEAGLGYDEPGCVHPDDGADWDGGVNKIECIAGEFDPVLMALRDELLSKYPDLEIRASWSRNIEICPPGCHKGAAIRRLSGLFGVPVEEIMVLGDNENDIPMLQATGLGVCMSNGTDGARAAADHVVDNSDNCGVARAIRRFALGE